MGEFFVAAARVSGAFIAIVAAWSVIQVIVHMANNEPFGGDLIGAIFAGTMAAILLSVRKEKPPDTDYRDQD